MSVTRIQVIILCLAVLVCSGYMNASDSNGWKLVDEEKSGVRSAAAADKWMMLDLSFPGDVKRHARASHMGVVCDAGRKLIYSINTDGIIWVLKLEKKDR